ncbi:MAG: hypothetical protein N2C14_30260, partial [Planctomycetales bacterium]
IRDALDWLEPRLQLDLAKLSAEVRRRAVKLIPAWKDWTFDRVAGGPVVLESRWDESQSEQPSYRLTARPRERFLVLTRKMKINRDSRWLVMAVSRPEQDADPAPLQLDVNGQRHGVYDPPVRGKGKVPEPLLISLKQYVNQYVNLRLIQLPAGPRAVLDWRAARFLPRPPGLWQLFEDEPGVIQRLKAEEDEEVAVENSGAYTGNRFLKIAVSENGPDKGNAKFPGMRLVIRSKPKIGEFRYLRFAGTKEGGPSRSEFRGRKCLGEVTASQLQVLKKNVLQWRFRLNRTGKSLLGAEPLRHPIDGRSGHATLPTHARRRFAIGHHEVAQVAEQRPRNVHRRATSLFIAAPPILLLGMSQLAFDHRVEDV